jgi:soluble lytic murein transglycosylase-like protein
MKKFAVLAAGALLLACSATYPRGELYFLGPQRAAAALVSSTKASDPGLALYRDPRLRGVVESFYSEVAGDAGLSRIILQQASAQDIPLPLAFALAWGESQFNVLALNRNPQSVDRGLFQLNSRTFPHVKLTDFYDPQVNARLGMKHLRFCLNQGESELVALAIYNAGALKVRKGTPYTTLNHIARILEYREKLADDFLRALAGRPGPVEVL